MTHAYERRGFGWERKKEKDHSEELEVGRRTVLREIGYGGMHWIYLPQDTNQWRAPINTVMNRRFP
jgi:hypothetical protein